MVACTDRVVRLSSSGAVLQTYTRASISPTETSQLFALNLDPDGTSFWTAGIGSGNVYRVDIATGAVRTTFNAQPFASLAGLAIFGEQVAGLPTATPTLVPATATPSRTPTPTPTLVPATATPSRTPTPTATATPTPLPPAATATPTPLPPAATATPTPTTAAVPLTAVPLLNLSITGTISPSNAAVGSQVTETFTITNPGPTTANNPTFTAPLPPNATFVSATGPLGACTGTTIVTCNLGTLLPGASTTVTIVLIPTAAGPLSTTATVTGGGAALVAAVTTTVAGVVTAPAPAPAPAPATAQNAILLVPPLLPPPPPPILSLLPPPPPPGLLRPPASAQPMMPEVPVIPEADTLVLLGLGALVMLGLGRRRR